MTINDLLGRVVRPAIVAGGIIPAVVIGWRLVQGEYANPAEALEHATGFTALWFLLASLAATPLRTLTGRPAFTRLRKPLGLWAFAYATIHLGCYLVFDQSLLWGEIWYDIRERPYITVGFAAFLILSVLAVTSLNRVARLLGGRRWKALHRMVYVAAALGVLHFLWLVKRDITRPVVAATVLVALLALRLPGQPRHSGTLFRRFNRGPATGRSAEGDGAKDRDRRRSHPALNDRAPGRRR